MTPAQAYAEGREQVLRVLEEAGIPRERVMGIDRQKVDEALEVTELAESAVYEIDESAYCVRSTDPSCSSTLAGRIGGRFSGSRCRREPSRPGIAFDRRC